METVETKNGDMLFDLHHALRKRYFSLKAFLHDENRIAFLLGSLVNDTAFKQGKYFRTEGLLKKLTPFLNFITPTQFEEIFLTCDRIQGLAAKSERVKKSFLIEEIKREIDKKHFKWSGSQDSYVCAFITGYNLYSQCIFFLSEELKGKKVPEIWSPSLDYYKKMYADLEAFIDRPRFAGNEGYRIGVLLGMYYIRNVRAQGKFLKTGGLLKDGMGYFKSQNYHNASKLLREINRVVVKIASVNSPQKSDKQDFNGVFLNDSELELELATHFLDHEKELDEIALSIGFFVAFTVLGKIRSVPGDKNGYKHSDQELVSNPNEEIEEIGGEPREDEDDMEESNRVVVDSKEAKTTRISFDDIMREIETSNIAQGYPSIAYLTGVLLNSYTYFESRFLKTGNLKKKFGFLFRRFDLPSVSELVAELGYTHASCWIKQSMSKARFSPYPKLREELLLALGGQHPSCPEAELSILLVKGANITSKISWLKNQENRDFQKTEEI